MPGNSIHDKQGRIRPSRVQIRYDVNLNGALQKREIPFLLGVLADLAGKPKEPLRKLRERKFIDIDRDNFDAVLKGMQPRVNFQVDNKLPNQEKKTMSVDITFSSREDFEATNVVRKVEPLRRLLEAREQLSALLNKAEDNDKLSNRLQEILDNDEQLHQLAKDAGVKLPEDSNQK